MNEVINTAHQHALRCLYVQYLPSASTHIQKQLFHPTGQLSGTVWASSCFSILNFVPFIAPDWFNILTWSGLAPCNWPHPFSSLFSLLFHCPGLSRRSSQLSRLFLLQETVNCCQSTQTKPFFLGDNPTDQSANINSDFFYLHIPISTSSNVLPDIYNQMCAIL